MFGGRLAYQSGVLRCGKIQDRILHVSNAKVYSISRTLMDEIWKSCVGYLIA